MNIHPTFAQCLSEARDILTRCQDCEGTRSLTCGMCSGTGTSPESFDSMRPCCCLRCGGSGSVKCEGCNRD